MLMVVLIPLVLFIGIPCFITWLICSKKLNRRTLRKEIERWKKDEMLSEDSYRMLSEAYPLPEKKHVVHLMQIVYIVASIFIGLGFILFIASNWESLPAWSKLAIVLVLAIISLITGEYYRHQKSRGLTQLGEGLVLLSAMLWGAGIIFLFQSSHWAVHYNALMVGIWIVSIVPYLLWLKSEPTFYLILLLCFLWGIFMKELSPYALMYYFVPHLFLLWQSRQDRIKETLTWSLAGILVLFFLNTPEQALLYLLLLGLLALSKWFFKKDTYFLVVSGAAALLVSLALMIHPWSIVPWLLWLGFIAGIVYGIHKTSSTLVLTLLLSALFLRLPGWLISLSWQGEAIVAITLGAGSMGLLVSLILLKKTLPYYSWIWTSLLVSMISLFFLSSYRFLETEAIAPLSALSWTRDTLPFLVLAGMLLLGIGVGIFFKKRICWKITPPVVILVMQACLLLSVLLFADAWHIRIFLNNLVLLFSIILTFFWANEENQPVLFYAGMAALLLFTILRYTDFFWSMLDRSVFFVLGGLILLCIGIILEKQKKIILERGKKNEDA